jgi:hypothetical protein
VLLISERLRDNTSRGSIPDCKALLDWPMRTMQAALIAAFAEVDGKCAQLQQSASNHAAVRLL